MAKSNCSWRRIALGLVVAVLCLVGTVNGQSLPTVVSYPTIDSGWTKTGNVNPVSFGCTPSCNYDVSTITGTDSGFAHQHTTPFESQGLESLQVQSGNGNASFISLLVNFPSTQNYKIAVAVWGAQSSAFGTGTLVWPQVSIYVGGVAQNICKYPNNTSITQTTALFVTNHTLPDYIETCSTQHFAGSSTINVQINGGRGFGGILWVGHVILYPASGTLKADAGFNSTGTTYVNNSNVTATDLFGLITAARNWANSNGGTGKVVYTNVRGGTISSVGCNNAPNNCGMLQMD